MPVVRARLFSTDLTLAERRVQLPWVASAVWSTVSVFLDERTANKVTQHRNPLPFVALALRAPLALCSATP